MRFVLFLFLSISIVVSAQQSANKDVITVMSAQLEQLDTGLIEWQLDDNQIAHYFLTAKQIENKEAAKFISENYYPCSMTGNLIYQGKNYNFILHASGVGILHDTNGIVQFYTNDSANQDLFNNLKWNSENLNMFLISQQRYFNCEQCGEDLCNWCKKWRLSIVDFNKYVSLCKRFTNSSEFYATFYNYPCWLRGYLVWEEQIYLYSLESSAPLRIRNIVTGENVGMFGCLNKKEGEKYVFEVAIDKD
jgi:hypothetical protein